MNPPRPNEGIDVEKEAQYFWLWISWPIKAWAFSHVSFHKAYWDEKLKMTKAWWGLKP